MRRLLIALPVLLIAALFGVAWLPLRQSREAWRAHHAAEAIMRAESWSRLRLWSSQYHQLLAASYLDVGNRDAARPHLDALSHGGRLWVSVLPKEEVARQLKYEDFLAYDAAVHQGDNDEIRARRAAAQIATGKLADAEQTLRSPVGGQAPRLFAALAARKSGFYPLLFDRNNQPIAVYQMANKDLVAINRDFEALTATFATHLPRLGVNDTIETTLDPAVQKAAMQALGGFRGSLVAIDPRTNELLAIASTAHENLAFDRQYEPGSIVKVLTGLNALESGVDVKSMFPYECKGDLLIDGRHFGDWLGPGHGVLPALDDALAESCNIFFADVGLRVGADRLHGLMSAAGFDQQADLGVFAVPLGKSVGRTFNNFETALYSIGLAHESINTLHAAMVASMMANRGVLTTPRLLRARRSILGEVTMQPPAQGKTVVAKPENAALMVQAMVAVATKPKGTGRRAPVEGITLAMKTGTAGDRADGGLEALIIAFAPVENPRIAFAIIAEDAGPAEYAGAKIAHDFVRGVTGSLLPVAGR